MTYYQVTNNQLRNVEWAPTDRISDLLEWLGEDPNREGLLDTPKRVCRAFLEMTSGMREDPAQILSTKFSAAYDEMVIVKDIKFTSVCEHHLLPFVGTAVVGYLPDKQVIGLSKIPRLVECFAKRLQLQERLTTQIAESLQEHLQPKGVGVHLTAFHSCMGCRGVKQAAASMVTSSLLGEFRNNPSTRSEFFQLARS